MNNFPKIMDTRQYVSNGGDRMELNARAVSKTFADHIYAYGGRPLLRQDDQRVIGGPFWVQVTITDNAVVNADLRNANLWDQRVQGLYGNAATPVRGVLHLEGLDFYMNDDLYLAETAALKSDLDNRLYIVANRKGAEQRFPLRGRIWEPWARYQRTQMTAANGDFLVHHPSDPWVLERPLRIDLETDQLQARVDTAINWAGGDMVGYLRLHGMLAPKDLPGAGGIPDTGCSADPYIEDQGGAPTAAGPILFRGLGRPFRWLRGGQ